MQILMETVQDLLFLKHMLIMPFPISMFLVMELLRILLLVFIKKDLHKQELISIQLQL